MPLDPAIADLLAEYYAQRPDSQWSVDHARQRHEFLVETMGKEPVPGIESRDVTITGEGGPLRLRIYRPEGGLGPRRIMVYLHGGSWIVGSVDSFDAVARRLAKGTGSIVVSVDYRLAPEHPFPAGWNDCRDAITWVFHHAHELGGHQGSVSLIGDSAGGNFAAAMAVWARDTAVPLAGLLLFYPSCDLSRRYPSMDALATGYLLETPPVDFPDRAYLVDGVLRWDPRVSPVLHESLAGLPPTVVYTAEFDPIKDQGTAFAHRLRAAGGAVVWREAPGMIHGFLHAGRSEAAMTQADQACREMVGLLALHGR